MSQFFVTSTGGGGGGGIETISGNTGTTTSGATNVTIETANTTVQFAASGTTITQDFGLPNLALGSSLPALTSGNYNVSVGQNSMRNITTGVSNASLGFDNLLLLTTGSGNVAIGETTLQHVTTGSGNIGIGGSSLSSLLGVASVNTAVGSTSLSSLATGQYNTVLGNGAGQSYTGAESSNILIGNNGTLGESNTMRLGTQGSGNGQVNATYIAGITGVTVTSLALVSMNTSTGQIGQFASANNGVVTTGTSGTPTVTALSANGQLLIGSGSGAPAAATLTAGTGITITNAANAITLAVTNPLTASTVDGAVVGSFGDAIVSISPQTYFHLYDDCIATAPWDFRSSGTGAQCQLSTIDSSHPGVFLMTPGTTNSGNATLQYSGASGSQGTYLLMGGGNFTWTCYYYIGTLGTAGNQYSLIIGMHDGNEYNYLNNGFYFTYAQGTSANWQFSMSNGGTASSTTSSLAVTTGWHLFQINGTTSAATFSVDGTSLGTQSTNYPTNGISPCAAETIKSSGTSALNFYIDWFDLLIQLTR